jgi:hypothetical protein
MSVAAGEVAQPTLPFITQGGEFPEEVIAAIDSLVAAGERDAAVELMMAQIVGLPAEALGQLRADPAAWQPMVDSVHTLPREFRSVDEFRFDAARYRNITVPTVLLRGAAEPTEPASGSRAGARCHRRRPGSHNARCRPRSRHNRPRCADWGPDRGAKLIINSSRRVPPPLHD